MKATIVKNSFLRLALVLLLSCGSGVLFLSFTSGKITSDFWKQLGIDESSGTEHIKKTFLQGYLSYGRAKVGSGDKVAIAADLLKYTRNVMESEAFRSAYEQERENRKPVASGNAAPKTKEQLQQELIKETEESIASYEQMIKTMGPDIQKSLGEAMQALKEQLKSYRDPENEMLTYMLQAEQMQFQEENRQHIKNLQNWESAYPADHRKFVKNRLEKFLQLTADVDYDAALKEVNGKKKFVDPVYESKPKEWKMAYRSGREVTETARKFVKQWLTEI